MGVYARLHPMVYPYYPGITGLPKVEEARDGLTGEEYYRLTQRRRGMERRIRETKRDIAQLETAGASTAQKRLVLGQQHRLDAFTKQNGLVRQPRREKAYGIGAQPRALRSATLHRTPTGGTIGVKIDKFVACLEDQAGHILPTESVRLTAIDLKGFNQRTGWYINWQTEAIKMEVYGLRLQGDTQIQGLISLVDDPENSSVKLGWVAAAPWNQGKRGSKRYLGVGGHMFAIAAQRSVDLGYNGFMWGIAKNPHLLEHYVKLIGARGLGNSYRIEIDERAARVLLEKYNWTAT
jgi:hypothetical protein